MDIPQSIKAIPLSNGVLGAIRRRAIPILGAVVLAVVLWDWPTIGKDARLRSSSPGFICGFSARSQWPLCGAP